MTLSTEKGIPIRIQSIWYGFLCILVNCLGVWGAIETINSAFHLKMDMGLILACTSLFVLLAELSSMLRGFSKRVFRYLSWIPIFIEIMIGLIAFLVLKKEMIIGSKIFFNFIVKAYNYYYGWMFGINEKYLVFHPDITLPFCLFSGILAILLSFCIGRKNKPMFAFVILMPCILISLACGKAPGINGIIAIICCLLSILFNSQVDRSLSSHGINKKKTSNKEKDIKQSYGTIESYDTIENYDTIGKYETIEKYDVKPSYNIKQSHGIMKPLNVLKNHNETENLIFDNIGHKIKIATSQDKGKYQSNVLVTEEFYRKTKINITTLALFIGFAILFISTIKIYPDYKKDINAYQDSFSEGVFLEKLRNISGISLGVSGNTGLNEGKLGSMIEVKSTGKTDLVVKFEKETTNYLYLKAYTGVTYTGKEWKADKNDGFEKVLKKSGLDSYKYLQPTYTLLKDWDSAIPMNEAEITCVDANDKYIYTPYYSLVTKNDGKGFQDLFIYHKGNKKTSYFDYYEFSGEEAVADYVKTNIKVEDWEKEYRSYVYENYLEVPKSLKRLRKEYANLSVDSWQVAANMIRDDLANRAAYTLSPGSTPMWEDFVEYFLYSQKKGYCVHFASTATLMFRLMGIPARYAEGYLVKPSGSSKTVEVTDEHAHAWVEIYVDGFGWTPIEVTPGYSEGGSSIENTIATMKQQSSSSNNNNNVTDVQGENQNSNKSSNSEKKEDTSTTKNQNLKNSNETNGTVKKNPNTTKNSNSSSKMNEGSTKVSKSNPQKKDSQSKNQESLLKLLIKELSKRNIIIVTLFVLSIAIVNYRYWYIKKSLRKKPYEWFHQNRTSARIKSIYREIGRIAKYEGNAFDVYSTAKEVCENYPFFEERTIEHMQNLMKEVLYSRHPMTEEQCKYMYDIYIKFHDNWKNKKKIKRRLVYNKN